MDHTTKICVITAEYTDEEIESGAFTDAKKEIEKVIGANSFTHEGVEANGKLDLFFEAPTAGLNALIDKLNDMDCVSLAHYRDGFGNLYPAI